MKNQQQKTDEAFDKFDALLANSIDACQTFRDLDLLGEALKTNGEAMKQERFYTDARKEFGEKIQ